MTIYNKIVREFWNSSCEVYLRLIFEFIGHGNALGADHLAEFYINGFESCDVCIATYKDGAKAKLNPVAQTRISSSWSVPLSSITPSGTILAISLWQVVTSADT